MALGDCASCRFEGEASRHRLDEWRGKKGERVSKKIEIQDALLIIIRASENIIEQKCEVKIIVYKIGQSLFLGVKFAVRKALLTQKIIRFFSFIVVVIVNAIVYQCILNLPNIWSIFSRT